MSKTSEIFRIASKKKTSPLLCTYSGKNMQSRDLFTRRRLTSRSTRRTREPPPSRALSTWSPRGGQVQEVGKYGERPRAPWTCLSASAGPKVAGTHRHGVFAARLTPSAALPYSPRAPRRLQSTHVKQESHSGLPNRQTPFDPLCFTI